jgi:subtilisin family serine protease
MSGRYAFCCMVGVALAALLSPLTLSAEAGNQFIVRTTNPEVLQSFAAEHGAEVDPLIYYPNPSKETMELYGDQYIIKFAADDHSSINRVMNEVEYLPGVEFVQPDEVLDIHIPEWDEEQLEGSFNSPNPLPYTPNDPRYPDQWDKTLTETDWAWNLTKGEGAIVAVLDQGVDTTHEDLNENLYMCYNSVDNDSNYHDLRDHGTSCCGYAAARIDNNVGIAGMAGEASLMAIRVFPDVGGAATSVIINAINYAVDNGAKVISMSFGAYGNVGLEWTLNSVWDRGVFSCAGAGNDNTDDAFYPAAYEKVMGVGVTTSADERSSGSNYGINAQVYSPCGLTTKPGNNYGSGTATSYATPQVAGLAALIFSAYPHATPQQVWDNIIEGADTLDSDVGKILRINSRKAVETEIIAVEEERAKPVAVSALSIQNGVIRLAASASTEYSLKLFDVTGSQVYSTEGATTAKGELTCEPQISRGVYFWQFVTSEGVSSGKFVYVK